MLTSASDMCIKGRLFITERPTPMTQTTPPLLAANAAVQMLLSTPVHSNTVGGARYSSASAPYSLLISFAFSSAPRFTSIWYVVQLGSSSLAKASLFGSTSVITIGCAPEARAAARAMRPMGPAPQMRAGRPRLRPPVRTP